MSFEADLVELLPRLQGRARKLTRSTERARDLVQDTVLRALERKDKFAPGTNLAAWLYTIMYHLYVNEVRHVTRFPHVSLSPVDGEGEGAFVPTAPPPQEYTQALRQCLARIKEFVTPEMVAPVLLAAAGWEMHETAERLKIPHGTVKSRLCRGRARLKEAFQWS